MTRALIKRIFGSCIFLSTFISVNANELQLIIKDCDTCHGKNGVSTIDEFPTIAGFSSFYLDDNLRIYRDKARFCEKESFPSGEKKGQSTTMCELSEKMTDEVIQQLADHYASQPFVAAKQAFDQGKAEIGKKVHERYCEKCHANGGSDNADDAGVLAGQWMHYLKETFEHYDSGEREQPKKMKEKYNELDAEMKEALLHFYASQQ